MERSRSLRDSPDRVKWSLMKSLPVGVLLTFQSLQSIEGCSEKVDFVSCGVVVESVNRCSVEFLCLEDCYEEYGHVSCLLCCCTREFPCDGPMLRPRWPFKDHYLYSSYYISCTLPITDFGRLNRTRAYSLCLFTLLFKDNGTLLLIFSGKSTNPDATLVGVVSCKSLLFAPFSPLGIK